MKYRMYQGYGGIIVQKSLLGIFWRTALWEHREKEEMSTPWLFKTTVEAKGAIARLEAIGPIKET